MNGELVLLISIALLVCVAGVVLLAIAVSRRRRRTRTPMEAARQAVRAASRESARLGRSGLQGKGSGNQYGESAIGDAHNGA
ncbi:hypothetical protein [Catellatospora vulcania]|uniref:hypothetical protein n=1 Tax=Catellatospora vulcania TaxID=1460450 RepID=UPI0012D4237A|nr:hypothetical protein [Catellatospora vulcania]